MEGVVSETPHKRVFLDGQVQDLRGNYSMWKIQMGFMQLFMFGKGTIRFCIARICSYYRYHLQKIVPFSEQK